ncbi:MAG TPA: nucleotidyltransferase family protein [Rhizomicrobium sp.]
MRAAAAAVSDWDRLLRVAIRHRVEAMVHAALAAAAIDMPAAVSQALTARAQRIVAGSMATAAESVRLQTLFDGAGIPLLVLKGAALAELAYGTLAVKRSRDIDLFVAPNDVDAALRLLAERGYGLGPSMKDLMARHRRLVLRHGRELALLNPETQIVVELRWRLVESPALLAGVDIESASQTVPMPAIGAVRTFQTEDLFAYLCLHGAAHGWSRLKWLADLNALIGSADDAEILRLYRHAQARGTGICAGLALLLCHRVLGRPLPASLLRELDRGPRLRVLAALVNDIMVGPDAVVELEDRTFGTTRVALMQFLLGGGWRNFVAQYRVMSIRLDDVVRYPLPAPLHFVYPLLRLPVWLWRRCVRESGVLLLRRSRSRRFRR